MPLVFASRASYLDDVDLIRPDNMQAAQLVTEHLIRRGHQRIALARRAECFADARRAGRRLLRHLAEIRPAVSQRMGAGVRVQSEAGGGGDDRPAAPESDHHRGAVLQQRGSHRRVVRSVTGWKTEREDGVESYFEQRVALAAFADVPEAALDDLPLTPGDHPGAGDGEKPGGFDAAAAGRGDWRDAKPDYAPAAGDAKMRETARAGRLLYR